MRLEEQVVHLQGENAELRQLVAQLQHELALARQQIAELQQPHSEAPPFVKPNRSKQLEPKAPRKKRAPQHNRNRRREPPTRIETHALERCPECNYRLQASTLDYTRQVIELPPPPAVEVIEHQL